jgi:hypothetical protein
MSAAQTTYDVWMIDVLWCLTGNRNYFPTRNEALRDANYNLVRECWNACMTQYEAAEYYKAYSHFYKCVSAYEGDDFMKPRDWLKQRRAKEELVQPTAVCTECLYNDGKGKCHCSEQPKPERMVKLSVYRFAVVVASIIGVLIGWFCRGMV